MEIHRDFWRKEGSLQVVRAYYFSLSWWNHIYVKPLDEPHPDKYDESSKESRSQCKLDSFVHVKKCSAECAEEITRRIAVICSLSALLKAWISSIF